MAKNKKNKGPANNAGGGANTTGAGTGTNSNANLKPEASKGGAVSSTGTTK